MVRIHYSLLLATCGLFLVHTATGQAALDTSAAATGQVPGNVGAAATGQAALDTSAAATGQVPGNVGAAATGQVAVDTSAAGKSKTDQSTVVWTVSTDTLDPTVNGVGTGGTLEGQTKVNTLTAVKNTPTNGETPVVKETTSSPLAQDTTANPLPPVQINMTPFPPAQNLETSAPPTSLPVAAATDPTASPNIRTDVTDTVMALLNETGYSGHANDANVQEIVTMLMNGKSPMDRDLIRLGFIAEPPPAQVSTPPPYVISGNQPVVDTNINFQTGSIPTGVQPLPGSGTSTGATGLGTFPNAGFQFGGFPSTGGSTGGQSGTSSGTGTGGSTDPFGGAFTNIGGTGGIQTFPSSLGNLGNLGGLGTTPKPALGDPFGMNTINGGQLPPSLGTLDPNALGPKPFPNVGPIGGLGTPGSTTDLLANLGPMPGSTGAMPGGMGSFPSTPQTGILDAAYNQQQQQQGGGMNQMMMMMMLNPEMMDMMMSGENPMLTMMMMQQMMRRPQRRPPPMSNPLGMGGLGGFPGTGLGGTGGMSMPLPGSAPLGGSTGGIMDLMRSIGSNPLSPGGLGTGGASPIDLSALGGLGSLGPTPGGASGNPMDLLGGALGPSPGPTASGNPMDLLGGGVGPSPGPTDMSPFLNMINTGAGGTLPSSAPLTNHMLATAG